MNDIKDKIITVKKQTINSYVLQFQKHSQKQNLL